MSLPAGAKRLLYIQSDGRQYLNSEFIPDPNTRVVMDAQLTAATTQFYFGARDSADGKSKAFTALALSSSVRSDYGTSQVSVSLTTTNRYTIDKNKNVFTIGGQTITNTANTFTVGRSLYLFACNTQGTATNFSKLIAYWCQVYGNGTLVRDYIPCQLASGEVGMWDDVYSVFYGDAAGVGFIAGPEVVPPSPPENLRQLHIVALSWDAVSNAASYRVYRNGSLLAETTDTGYTDTTPLVGVTYTYSVTSIVDRIESEATTLEVEVREDYSIITPIIESAFFQ